MTLERMKIVKESIKLSIKKIVRSSAQSILLLFLFFIIGNLLFGGLGILSASEQAKEEMRLKMNPVITYLIDNEKTYRESRESIENGVGWVLDLTEYITEENVKRMGSDSRVVAVDSLMSGYIELENIDPIVTKSGMNEAVKFSVVANYFDDMVEFHNGDYELIDGRFYTNEEIESSIPVILVSDELAETNNLKVGDILQFSANMGSDIQFAPEDLRSLDAEIIGIYKNNKKEIKPFYIGELKENIILMPSTTYTDYYKKVYDSVFVEYYGKQIWNEEVPEWRLVYYGMDNVFLLNDPAEVDSFVQDYADAVNEYAIFDINNKTYESLAKPLDSISNIAKIVVLSISVVSLIIISLVSALTFRTRDYEVGVLLSMGVKKMNIIVQLFLEMTIIAVLGFTLSIATGNVLSKKVGNTVLDTQMSSKENQITVVDDEYFNKITAQDVKDSYEVKIDGVIIVEAYGLGIFVILISTLFPLLMLMKADPKKIMMNMK